jgi:hypothetical protein
MGKVLGVSLEEYALMEEKSGAFADRAKTGNLGRNQVLLIGQICLFMYEDLETIGF